MEVAVEFESGVESGPRPGPGILAQPASRREDPPFDGTRAARPGAHPAPALVPSAGFRRGEGERSAALALAGRSRLAEVATFL